MDVWVLKRRNEFQATWRQGSSENLSDWYYVQRLMGPSHLSAFSRMGIGGCLVSFNQGKASDRVERHYLMAALWCFGFPQGFVDMLGPHYRGLTWWLIINGQLAILLRCRETLSRDVLCHPCFLPSPSTLYVGLVGSPSFRRFALPGQAQVKVSTYTDDVSLFVWDSGSFVAFMRVFNAYGELSGARKSRGNVRHCTSAHSQTTCRGMDSCSEGARRDLSRFGGGGWRQQRGRLSLKRQRSVWR